MATPTYSFHSVQAKKGFGSYRQPNTSLWNAVTTEYLTLLMKTTEIFDNVTFPLGDSESGNWQKKKKEKNLDSPTSVQLK